MNERKKEMRKLWKPAGYRHLRATVNQHEDYVKVLVLIAMLAAVAGVMMSFVLFDLLHLSTDILAICTAPAAYMASLAAFFVYIVPPPRSQHAKNFRLACFALFLWLPTMTVLSVVAHLDPQLSDVANAVGFVLTLVTTCATWPVYRGRKARRTRNRE